MIMFIASSSISSSSSSSSGIDTSNINNMVISIILQLAWLPLLIRAAEGLRNMTNYTIS